MTRQSFSRTVKVTTASLMAVLFGFPGVAIANQASISTTGPDSYNKIEFNDKTDCTVENNNDIKTSNHVTQNAQTGDATVGGSGWEAYSPEAWQASGHSYEEWESAVNDYLAQNKHDWKNKWGSHGGGNTTGGDATSGDATNVSNNSTNIAIDNSGACAFGGAGNSGNGGNGQGAKPGSKPGTVLGDTSSTNRQAGKGGAGNVLLGANTKNGLGGTQSGALSGNYGQGASSGVFYPTTSGGVGGNPSGSNSAGGNVFSIGNTGPDSYNKISYDQSSHTTIKNTNNVSVKNYVTQNASSGNASVSGNTTGGAADSGGAHNSSGSNTGAGINN